MKALLFSHVFNGKIQTVLIAENRLVLRAVVHENAFYLRHERHQRNICDKDADLDKSLDDTLRPAEGNNVLFNAAHKQGGQPYKQKQSERHTEYCTDK